MKRNIGISKLQKQITSVVFDIENSNLEVTITKKGKPVAVIISMRDYNAVKEMAFPGVVKEMSDKEITDD